MTRKEILSEVSGKVWKIEVQEGAAIGEEEPVMIIDSMKMEIPILTTESGRIAQLLVKEDDPVTEGQVVAIIDTDSA
ncbi:acetyl-CoA carboxylase biotin carboxyl carrier protein subunit [Paralcaligenes sp. KSB-10]|uniref:acetyl-CoA carboxylase biotin carboxyl carrier protein subunit n=1 Tax=Paralcaligenes sp. KSB-10 TaxID=2901142 RepID=UPI001E447CA2|nr:acetyl-CoA carboxylase biotin carboxyl carrier protein subunit [Paralcaligenes sp. KSB-10]UHL65455.1 acetyl-CoA carboxylase biotin carboxyl carrier protein subunit [Paralcaligenes sp. KSB-10]